MDTTFQKTENPGADKDIEKLQRLCAVVGNIKRGQLLWTSVCWHLKETEAGGMTRPSELLQKSGGPFLALILCGPQLPRIPA